MQVHGPSHIHGAQSLNGPHLSRLGHSSAPTQSPAIRDELELSPMGQLLDKVQELPDIRSDLVARIRAEIAAGTYETEEKLEIALERLLDEIG
jgi:negative regulator of flagellin synthesis FlgM